MSVAHVAGGFKNTIIICPADISELDPCVSRLSHILFRSTAPLRHLYDTVASLEGALGTV
jgi:hypothetical protein